jgi:glycosyltransferase involved in cell wall biosynthesis
MRTLLQRIFPSPPVATVAINMRSTSGPWGGSSTFVSQLKAFLEARGWRVTYRLSPEVDAIILIDPRDDLQLKAFGMREIIEHKKRYPKVRVIHRVNECDQRKGTSFMDPLLAEANAHADFTVFIAEWLREYHAERWFDRKRPHDVIYNGADAGVFHPIGQQPWKGKGPLRIVTHHWSDNPLKGFDVYEQVDRLLTDGKLPGFEFWVIGRWPARIQWKSARTFPPSAGHALAAQLRACHLYLTATRWEPCGMHHVEGAQCGLPLLYHEDGGGVVEAGLRYGLGFRDDVGGALIAARDRYAELHAQVLARIPSGDRMVLSYAEILQRLLAERDGSIR